MTQLDLICIDCEKEFFFKEKEKQFYLDQGYDIPKRCYHCRKRKKNKKLEKARSAIVLVRDKKGV